MSFEEQQRDELDALEAIYAEEYECKYLLLWFITKLIQFSHSVQRFFKLHQFA